LINGVYQFSAWAAVFAGLTIIVGAVYMLRSFQGIMLGETNSTTANFGSELTMNEKAVLFIVAAAVIVFGVYPNPLLDILHNDVAQLAQQIAVK
jgi:NADH-quinone oxidoreductase subunit M